MSARSQAAAAAASDRHTRDRVEGRVGFAESHISEGSLVARLVRATVHAGDRLVVRTGAARSSRGVVAVLTADELRARFGAVPRFGGQRKDQPVLADGRVRFRGEPIALVAARTDEQARDAAARVEVDVRERAPILSIDDAPSGSSLHEDAPGNVCAQWHLELGDTEQAFREAASTYREVFRSPHASHAPLEPHTVIAGMDAGTLRVTSATQSPHYVANELSAVLGLDKADVEVVAPPLGGGFGAKGQVRLEPLVAAAAMICARPVVLRLDHAEVFATLAKHAAEVAIETALDAAGNFVGRRVRVRWDGGAYAYSTPLGSRQALLRAQGPYRIPNVSIESVAYYTNKVPCGPFRGAMTSQLAWAYESHLDEIARLRGEPPEVLRRRNLLSPGDVYVTGERLDEVHAREVLDAVTPSIGDPPRQARALQTAASAGRGATATGAGSAVVMKSTLTPSRSEAELSIRCDGTVALRCAAVEMGQGAHATLQSEAARSLGIAARHLTIGPVTSSQPFDTSTSSSRTTFSMGVAINRAAQELLRRLDVASVNDQPGGEEHRYAQLMAAVRSRREAAVSAVGVFQSEGGLDTIGDGTGKPSTAHWHFGAARAVVEVHTRTGRVKVSRLDTAVYAGRVVDHHRVAQQNHGCAIMGLGTAIFEELRVGDPRWSLAGYRLPTTLDMPEVLTSRAVEDAIGVPYGVGEMVIPAIAPAIGNAIRDAVGVRLRDLPMTPERVLDSIVGREP